jgi:hypothetical protein
MQPKMSTISTALTTLGEQSALVQSNPAVMADSSWKLKTGVALGFLKGAGEEIQKYEPVPEGAEALDKTMVELGKDLTYVATEYAAGIDNLSAARMTNAATRLQAVNAKMPLATAQVKALTEPIAEPAAGAAKPQPATVVPAKPAAPAPAAPAPKPAGRVAPQGSACPTDAPIKGNQSGLYHVPTGASYNVTRPEACFATEAAAQAAGFRRAAR